MYDKIHYKLKKKKRLQFYQAHELFSNFNYMEKLTEPENKVLVF